MHRDVSINNILNDNSGETPNGLRSAVLADFDCADHERDIREEDNDTRNVSKRFSECVSLYLNRHLHSLGNRPIHGNRVTHNEVDTT